MIAVIQARLSSSRLPGKVLKKVTGKPLLAYQIERVKMARTVDRIILATSDHEEDSELVNLAKSMGIQCYRGDLNNVLKRFYCAVENQEGKENGIMRLTGDCPLVDPALIDSMVQKWQQGNLDYFSNVDPATYPDGMDIEIFSFKALKEAHEQAKKSSEREHVTVFIRNHKTLKKDNYKAVADFAHLRLTVDEEADFALIKCILEDLWPVNPAFGWLDVVAYLTKKPDLLGLNLGISRNEGLLKSILADEKEPV